MTIVANTDTDIAEIEAYLNLLATGIIPESHPNFGIYQSMIERIEKDALQGDIAGVLAKIEGLKKTGQFAGLGAGAGVDRTAEIENRERPATLAPATSHGNMPALPASAHSPKEVAMQGCRWLDEEWVPWSRTWAPNAYEHYHEMTGILLLSAIALRRVMMDEGGISSTNLYCLLAGRTGQYTKSTTANLVQFALNSMDLTWLLCDDDATPQKFLTDMTTTVPLNYEEMDPQEKHQEELRLAFAGQKAWLYDEFGNKIDAIARQGGFMSEYRKIFRTFDASPVTYKTSTQGRGKEVIERPYLSLLGSLTPKDVRVHAASDATMWGDGFLARFLISCPPPYQPPLDEERPRINMSIPESITEPLLYWHEQLGVHPVIPVNEGSENKPKWIIPPSHHKAMYCHWTDEAYNAYRAYRKALKIIQAGMQTDDLDGNYARLAEQAIRVAMLFAALDNNGLIEMRHWARAQAFIEHCREGLHHFYAQITMQSDSQDKQREDKVFNAIQKSGRVTKREICQITHESAAKVRAHLQELERDNLIQSEKLIAKNGREVIWYWCNAEIA